MQINDEVIDWRDKRIEFLVIVWKILHIDNLKPEKKYAINKKYAQDIADLNDEIFQDEEERRGKQELVAGDTKKRKMSEAKGKKKPEVVALSHNSDSVDYTSTLDHLIAPICSRPVRHV